MNLTNKAYFNVMLNCIYLFVIHPRGLGQFVFLSVALHPHRFFNKCPLAFQLLGDLPTCVDNSMVFILDSRLSCALVAVCQDGPIDFQHSLVYQYTQKQYLQTNGMSLHISCDNHATNRVISTLFIFRGFRDAHFSFISCP
jgi:hypothetical protein